MSRPEKNINTSPLDPVITGEIIREQEEERERQRREEEGILRLPLERPRPQPKNPDIEKGRQNITWDIGETPPSDTEDRSEETNDGVVHRWKM